MSRYDSPEKSNRSSSWLGITSLSNVIVKIFLSDSTLNDDGSPIVFVISVSHEVMSSMSVSVQNIFG